MNKQIVAGFVSVKSILESNSREVFRILLEKDRFNSVMRSTLRAAEKRQYEILLASGIPVTYLSAEDFSAEVSGSTAGGIAAEVGERKFLSLEEILAKKNGYFAILDGIEDPFNFGYALRSLYASGVDGVILPERNFFTATETVVRSSAGASELLPCCTVEDLAKACAEIKSAALNWFPPQRTIAPRMCFTPTSADRSALFTAENVAEYPRVSWNSVMRW